MTLVNFIKCRLIHYRLIITMMHKNNFNTKDSMDYLHALNQVINLPKKVKEE